jgi:cupin fold WbuC family metalloprotein
MKNISNFKNISEEVLYPIKSNIIKISGLEIAQLISNAKKTPRKRMRICAHSNSDDRLHEMIIVHKKNTYVRPHKHFGRSESFHIIYGRVDIVIYEDSGIIQDIIKMGDLTRK